jgi:hypothetical protein
MQKKKKIIFALTAGVVVLIFLIIGAVVLSFGLTEKNEGQISIKKNRGEDSQEKNFPLAEKKNEGMEKEKIENYNETEELSETKESSEKEAGNEQINEEQKPKVSNEDQGKTEEEGDQNDSEKEDDGLIKANLITWGFHKSPDREIDTVVIHSSYDALHKDPYDLEGLLEEYKQYGVAPHFVIDRKGGIFQLVDTKHIAYHAGEGEMPDGRTSINAFSVGIEMMNTEEDEYTEEQYEKLNELIDYLEDKYSIDYVLGHKDIAPGRKTDPWNFNWKKVTSSNNIHQQ